MLLLSICSFLFLIFWSSSVPVPRGSVWAGSAAGNSRPFLLAFWDALHQVNDALEFVGRSGCSPKCEFPFWLCRHRESVKSQLPKGDLDVECVPEDPEDEAEGEQQ